MNLTVSVMITTKNRAIDLQRTCQRLRQLNPSPLEVLITADGCTDDTIGVVKSEMPNARLIVNPSGKGSVASRDRMIREAKGDLIFALDDDSYPEQLDCLDQIFVLFARNPRLAVAHFPQCTDEYPETLTETDFGQEHPTRSFANSGAVLRRSIYLQLSGFEPKFFHMYEEPDYALQCVAAGYEVLFTPLVTIRHHFSGATRSEMRNHQRHARNEFWSTLLRCPFPYCPAMLGWRVLSQFRYACKRGIHWVVREPVWWWQALAGVPYCLKNRKPVSWYGYQRWLSFTD
ncbi:MAG TPA: glycosyltransferase [Verrucomicrobiae bacterium]|jgi:GT2 family glycosyltransferase